METINGLLKQLDNKVPASIAKRLDGLKRMNEKLQLAKQEDAENPTDESKEKLDEIINFIEDTQDDLIDDLRELVAVKQEADAKRQEQENAKKKKEEEEQEAQRLELEKQSKLDKEKEKESGGIGWGGLILGGALLVLSAGAINYFRKR